MKKNKTNSIKETEVTEAVVTLAQSHHDMVLALLVVSLLVNLFILTAWVTLQVTNVYDLQVASFLFAQ